MVLWPHQLKANSMVNYCQMAQVRRTAAATAALTVATAAAIICTCGRHHSLLWLRNTAYSATAAPHHHPPPTTTRSPLADCTAGSSISRIMTVCTWHQHHSRRQYEGHQHICPRTMVSHLQATTARTFSCRRVLATSSLSTMADS